MALSDIRNHLGLQDLEGFEVPEEAGHTDDQVLEQVMDFRRVFPQVMEIIGDIFDLVHGQAPAQAPPDGGLLIMAEVVFGVGPHQHQDFL